VRSAGHHPDGQELKLALWQSGFSQLNVWNLGSLLHKCHKRSANIFNFIKKTRMKNSIVFFG
jgi:hypothetical protein